MVTWTLYECIPKKTIAAFLPVYGAFRNRRLNGRVKSVKVVRQICVKNLSCKLIVAQVFDADCNDLDLILVPGG